MFSVLIILVVVIMYQQYVIRLLKKKKEVGNVLVQSRDRDEKGMIPVKHRWELDSTQHIKQKGELTLYFDKEMMEKLRLRNPYRVPKAGYDNIANLRYMYQYMLRHPSTFINLSKIAKYINRICSQSMIGELDKLQFVLDFVQEPNIRYIHDEDCKEIGNCKQYIRFPDETLFDHRGDCDCKSFLAAMLFHVMGYKVLFLMSQKLQHAAVCIEYNPKWLGRMQNRNIEDVVTKVNGKKYVFCETTSDGFRIGGIGKNQCVDDFDCKLELV